MKHAKCHVSNFHTTRKVVWLVYFSLVSFSFLYFQFHFDFIKVKVYNNNSRDTCKVCVQYETRALTICHLYRWQRTRSDDQLSAGQMEMITYPKHMSESMLSFIFRRRVHQLVVIALCRDIVFCHQFASTIAYNIPVLRVCCPKISCKKEIQSNLIWIYRHFLLQYHSITVTIWLHLNILLKDQVL